MMAPQGTEMTNTLGLGVVRLPLPVFKMYSVPKPQQQTVVVQQSPMMASPMMAQPMMMAPQMAPMAAQAPSCPSTDSANNALMMALMQAQQQQNAPAVPAAEDAQLEGRARKLEQRLKSLTDALEKGN
jgi:hypothetical protein